MLSSSLNPILSQPNLLERAKNNPNEGLKLCKKFKDYNAENKSATSVTATNFFSACLVNNGPDQVPSQ